MTRRKPLDKDLYEAVVEEAKTRFAVWPSAYASGWVVKTYKARGGRYGGESKGSRTGLTKWFGESWVDLSRPTADGSYEPCGRKRSDDPADYPKCRPEREAMRMSKEEVADAVRRKRRAEASAPARGSRARAPKRVATYKKNPPRNALVLVHTSSIDSFGAEYGKWEARALIDTWLNEIKAAQKNGDLVVIVDQGWDGPRRAEFFQKVEQPFLLDSFDEAEEDWAVFLSRLENVLTQYGVQKVTVGGIWYDPTERHGCVNTTYDYLKSRFDAELELDLCGVEQGDVDDDDEPQENPRENPFLATEDGSSAYYSTGGRYSPGVSFREDRPDGDGDFVEWSPDAPPWFPATGIPSPAQRMLEPAFREWFKDSKVVDERGLPLVVWHSNAMWNTADDAVAARFNAFDFSKQIDLGMHFGTLSAARTVGGLCRPFYLSLQNPLRVPDMESWVHGYPYSSDLPEHAYVAGHISLKLYSTYREQEAALLESFRTAYGDKLDARPLPHNLDREWRHRNSLRLRDLLLNAGYDGVVYENEHEDAGSISWIALHPGQIKSVENDGTWDFNDPDVRRNPRTGRGRQR